MYAKSTDKGEIWETMEVDSGAYSSITLDNSGMPRITYLKNDTIFCKILNSDNTWNTKVIFYGNENLILGPPVIAQTYPQELAEYSYCVFPIKTGEESKIYLSIFNVNEAEALEPKVVAFGEELKSHSIAITPYDVIHIVWEENGEIYLSFCLV